MIKKKIVFLLISIVLAIVLIDLFGHIIYYLRTGTLMQTKVYRLRPFTVLVHDERVVTNKKNFNGIIAAEYEGEKDWRVETDSNGFRIGTNNYFKQKDNFVFLGDSVLFGWGVNDDQNVPSRFYAMLKKNSSSEYGVINAAIPSYTLYQAIKRYEYEIDGRLPVKYIILQVFDPVWQFIVWGEKWDKNMSWTSKNSRYHETLLRYSSVYLIYNSWRINKTTDLTKKAFGYFKKENLSMLGHFHSSLDKDVTLIILPGNPTAFTENKISMVTRRFNKILEKFASSHENVYYFDVVSYFDKIGRKGLFLDSHCHLSEHGAQKQAEFIFEQLRINDLL